MGQYLEDFYMCLNVFPSILVGFYMCLSSISAASIPQLEAILGLLARARLHHGADDGPQPSHSHVDAWQRRVKFNMIIDDLVIIIINNQQ